MKSSKHALLSPSASERWMACPASLIEQRRMQELGLDDSSPAAAEGTLAHKWAARVLLLENTEEDIPEKFREHLKLYIDSVLDDVKLRDGRILAIEQYMALVSDPRIGGTADCIHRVDDTLVVTDLKYGQSVFVSADSMQLKIYAFLALRLFADATIKRVELRVVQPRCGRPPIRIRIFCANCLSSDVSERLTEAIARIDNQPELRVAGEHCRWCPANKVSGMPPCPAHVAACRAVLRLADSRSDIAEMARFVLDNKEALSAAIVQSEEWAIRHITDGGTIDGFTLAPRRANRKWSMSENEVAGTLSLLGLDTEKIWIRRIISPAQAEKCGLRGKINNLVERPETGWRIVRASQE